MGPRPADRQARHAGSSTAIRSSKEFGCGAWLPQYSKALPILSRYGQKATSGCIGQRDRQLRERPSFMTRFLTTGPANAGAHILLAHGAGAAMTSPFLEAMTRLLTERGLQVSRFEFAYMAGRREGGKRRPPPRAELLVPEYRRAVDELRANGASRQK